MTTQPNTWWGEFNIEEEATLQWHIGPLQIAVQRRPREWIVAHETVDAIDDEQGWHLQVSDQPPGEGNYTHFSRFVSQHTAQQLTVLPALADRSMVSRPVTPFTVLTGKNATIYVSTPLWFTLTIDESAQPLFETPIQRPSDTWFGLSTREGESCYASRTVGRLNLENLTVYRHRAITQVHIQNQSTAPLFIERLNLPVPYLSLFNTTEDVFWTEMVTMVQARGATLAEFHIEKNPPAEAESARLVTAPRQAAPKGMLVRAFSALRLQGFG